ncbi:uncharacterized protein LOC34623115, partial [Cyclospora cayetanensis]|uniref:Uncharacterized protein LOC34623115 n=1 Tax=Cyclospora cayetanensis TaxID=88456 RepID=A0A6P6RPZ1_9EIME
MVVACVCYVGRESEPLCFRVYGDSEEIPMQFAAYAALDVIDEQLAAEQQQQGAPGGPPSGGDSFLGLACPCLGTLQDASLYAYAAPTGLKILVGLSLKAPLHEQELRAVRCSSSSNHTRFHSSNSHSSSCSNSLSSSSNHTRFRS